MKLIILILSCLAYFASATDYCDKELCKKYIGGDSYSYVQHIACGNSGGFTSACPDDAVVVPTTPEVIKQILTLHNEFRNKIAGGNLEGYESAVRMPTLRWNNELAQIAELNARTCTKKHDACRNTDVFRHAGQNLANRASTDLGSDTYNIERLFNLWANEYSDCDQSVIDLYESQSGPAIGHFTALVHEKTSDVGCAITKFSTINNMTKFYLVCNYGYTNMMGEPIYTKGPACSKCTTGCNPDYKALCSPSEQVAPVSNP